MPAAVEVFSKGLDRHHGDPGIWQGLSSAYSRMGDRERALDVCTRAIERLPDKSELRCDKATLLVQYERYTESLRVCHQALDVWPQSGSILTVKGLALVALNKLEEALQTYTRAIALEEESIAAHCGMSNTLLEMGQLEESEQVLRKLVERSIRPHAQWNLIGNYFLAEGFKKRATFCSVECPQALKALNQSLQLCTDPRSLYSRACAYALMGLVHEAMSDLEQSIELRPTLRQLAKYDPDLVSLRNENRLQAILSSAG